MRSFLFIVLVAMSFPVAGQHTPLEIKKLKIATAIETSSFKEDGVPQKLEYKTYYDRNGNDTAFYSGDLCIYRKKYVLNESNRVSLVLMYDNYGNESEKTEYAYEANGNYSATSRHKLFDVVTVNFFDKTGRLLKKQQDDGVSLIYDYNGKGQLIQVMTKLENPGKGDIEHLKYNYNSKGQRIKEVSLGTYQWVKTIFYDAKGVMIKTISTGKEDGQAYTTTNTYKYTFWK